MAEPTQRVIPMLAYEDAGRAADWIAAAFGFRETGRWKNPDGTVSNVNMELGDGVFMLGHPSADYQGPRRHAEVCEHARREDPHRHRVESRPAGGTAPRSRKTPL